MFAITHKFKTFEGLDGINVFYYRENSEAADLDHQEVVRVYLDNPLICEEALQHALIALRHRLKASKNEARTK